MYIKGKRGVNPIGTIKKKKKVSVLQKLENVIRDLRSGSIEVPEMSLSWV